MPGRDDLHFHLREVARLAEEVQEKAETLEPSECTSSAYYWLLDTRLRLNQARQHLRRVAGEPTPEKPTPVAAEPAPTNQNSEVHDE